jgi:hypothetical protein
MGRHGVSGLAIVEEDGDRDVGASGNGELNRVGEYGGAGWDLYGSAPSKRDTADGIGLDARGSGSGDVVVKRLGKRKSHGDTGEGEDRLAVLVGYA